MTNDDDIPEENLGVAYDEALERRIAAEGVAEAMADTFVRLDYLADSHDLPRGLVKALREMQTDARQIQQRAERVGGDAAIRADRIRQRLHESSGETEE